MLTLFFSYSHKDEDLRDTLAAHLSMLQRQGLVNAIHDRRIMAGEDLDATIDAYLESADVILCLVSPDFIASNYCYSREMARALERHDAGEACVIPVILRHCEWQETPLGRLKGTPRDNKPVKAWADQDEALHDVAREVRRVVEGRVGKPKARVVSSPTMVDREAGVVPPRPRSANLHIARKFTDLDRDKCLRDAFDFVAEFFANSLQEIKARHPGIDGSVIRLDANRFTAAAYRDGSKVSAITVFIGGIVSRTREINFNNSDSGQTNSSNGSFRITEQGENLAFENLFGSWSQDRDKPLDHQAVAEEIWANFVAPLQRK